MAIAKKCDVCGKFYELYNVKNDAANTNGLRFLNIDAKAQCWSHEKIDCCPDCMTSIKFHIDNLKIAGAISSINGSQGKE